MRRLAWTAGVIGLCVLPVSVVAQRDVSCPTTLRSRFDNYQFVSFHGKEFDTQWQNTAGGPLGGPSYAWFAATPNPDPISTDGRARWRRARVLVHCFATLLWNGNRTYHYHPIAYNGTLESTETACNDPDDPVSGGGEYMTGDSTTGPVLEDGTPPLTRLLKDPDHEGAPPDTYMMDCGSSGGGGDSGGGGMSCKWEYMIIEISYDGGKTWYVWWEGWGQTCENEA